MKAGGSSAKSAPKTIIKKETINFSDIGAKLDIAEAMRLCDLLIINSMPIDSSSPYNIRFIELVDKLTLWNYIASEYKNDFFPAIIMLLKLEIFFFHRPVDNFQNPRNGVSKSFKQSFFDLDKNYFVNLSLLFLAESADNFF